MNSELYQEKKQYERFISNLNTCYNKLESNYSNLLLCEKNLIGLLQKNDECYDSSSFSNIIDSIEKEKNMIVSKFLPQAKYQYNEILHQIEKL